ncbi:MAG TPA: DUF1152 domain-containing protein [Roseiflexaceae bacterium]|nr:DUF1152 domain-containing protein [Roseiflexaceae bacterium]
MDLNLPILDKLAGCRSVLVAGMGGGFDVFCGLPLAFALQRRGVQVHLANYSFADIAGFPAATRLTNTLIGVEARDARITVYFPELHLATWLAEQGRPQPVWCFHKTGLVPLLRDYRALAKHLELDGLLLVDGGVDSLMRGDEAMPGTLIEDSLSLAAAARLDDIPTRLVACVGLGAEQEVSHRHAFENIAALAAEGAFLGACALTREMPVYQEYEAALLHAQSQPFQDPSVINSSIVSAVRGEYGDYHLTTKTHNSRLWISPLMTLLWFFDLMPLARRNLILDALDTSATFMDAVRSVTSLRRSMTLRKTGQVPL